MPASAMRSVNPSSIFGFGGAQSAPSPFVEFGRRDDAVICGV
jgi:hypothetical protein